MKWMKYGLLAIALVLGAGAASANDELKRAIEAANDELEAAIAAGDAGAAGAAYSLEGQILPPGGRVESGPVSIGAFWQAVRESGIAGAELTTLEVYDHGDMASEVGAFKLSNEEGVVVATGKYMVLWTREDGRWKLHRDIWNADPVE